MRTSSRIRRIAKWTGVGVCILILAAWGFSLRYWAYSPITKRVFVFSGVNELEIGVSAHPDNPIDKADIRKMDRPVVVALHWPRTSAYTSPSVLVIAIPFWLLILATAIPTAILFHRDRRRIPPGHCTKCGYDLTGNVSGACPACGPKVGAASRPMTVQNVDMRPPSHIRRIAKWTGVGLCVLIMAAWAFGAGKRGTWCALSRHSRIRLDSGEVFVEWGGEVREVRSFRTPSIRPDIRTYPTEGGWGLRLPRVRSAAEWRAHPLYSWPESFYERWVVIPIWLFLFAAAFPTAFLFHRDRRMPPGHCTKCGYDLTGNVTGVCPECGLKIGAASGGMAAVVGGHVQGGDTSDA